MRAGTASGSAACALVALLLVVSSSAVQTNGKIKIDGESSPKSAYSDIALTDEKVTSAADFLVDELNRRESSFAGVRSLRAILSAQDQALHTGHIYHIKVLLTGGSNGNEFGEGSVFVAPAGAAKLLKVKANKVSELQLARMGISLDLDDADSIGSAKDGEAAAAPVDQMGVMAVEFDVGFLDGIQVESPDSSVLGGTGHIKLAAISKPDQQASAAAVAAKRLKANADIPLPLNTSRQRKASKLGKA